MSPNLTKKELKTLKNALGKQGLTMEDHENAEKSEKRCEILQVDCFSLKNPETPEDGGGWYLGYGVEFNGVGVSAAAAESTGSSDDDEEPIENIANPESGDESSGFDSDPPSGPDEPPVLLPNYDIRRDSDDISDKGQLMYGVAEENMQEPVFYVDKSFSRRNVGLVTGEERKEFKTREFVVTNRFEVPKSRESSDDEPHAGYQMIGGGPIACTTSDSESEEAGESSSTTPRAQEPPEYPENSTSSSGLWCNFLISPPNLALDSENEKSIPLDQDKLAQISAAMANFKLPTPPGWEGVSDEKLLDFVKNRV